MTDIREMTVADLPEVFAVRISTEQNAVTMQELEDEYDLTPQTLAAAMNSSAKGWVCEVGGRIVGFAMGDRDEGEMTVIAVVSDCEQRGIGKQLIRKVQDWLFESGHEEIWLVTTPNPSFRAYGFYLSLGWTATGVIIDEEEKFVLHRK